MSEEIRPPYTYGTVSSKLVESQELITRLQARIDEYEFVGTLFGVMIYAKSPEDAKKISDMSKAMSVGQKDFTPPFLVEIDLASRVHIASLESERREFDKIIREYEQAKAEAEKQRVELEKWNAERYVGCVTHIANQQSRIDTLESENKALRLIAGSHSMSELRRNRTMAGWRRGDTLKNEVKHESKYY